MLGLSTPVNGPLNDVKPATADNSNDIFGYFMDGTTNGKTTTAVPSTTNTNPTKENPDTTLAQQEHDFFNQVPNEKEKAKMTKDSILALYATAPTMNTIPSNNQFMTGMPPMNDNGSLFGMPMQYQQQPAFGMPAVNANPQNASGINNFAQFGLMQQQGQPLNFQASNPVNSMPNQSMGFSNASQFNQANITKNNSFPAGNHASQNVNNVNQQFGSLNLGNVWQ